MSSNAASIPSNVTVNFDASGFTEGADHGSHVFTQGDFKITYSAANWFQDTDDGQSASAGLFAGAYSGVETITVETTSGNEFDFVSFYINAFGGGFASVEGFRNGSSVGTQSTGTGFGQLSGAYTVTLNNNPFDNVDKVVITSNSSGYFDVFDSFVFNTVPDVTPPTVTSVSAPSNATYSTGQSLSFTVNTSENVIVNTGGGTPGIALTIGATTKYATYSSGTGTSALVFSYVVESGLLDSDGIDVGVLAANGGTLKDAANNDMTLTLNSVGSTASVLVDSTAPTVSSVTASTANGTYKVGDTISIQVNFSETVTVNTGGGTPQLTLETGTTDRNASYTSGSGSSQLTFSYTVQAGDTSLDLDYVATNSLLLNGGTIRDAAANNANLTLASPGAANSLGANKALVVDGVVPTVTSVNSSTANGAYKASDVISIQVNFSETVTVNTGGGTPQLTLETGTTDRTINYVSGSGSSTLTFNYTIQADDNSADLDYLATNSLVLNGGTIQDAAGNNATLTLATPGAANSLGANKALVVDAVAPTVTNIAPTGSPAANAASMDFAVAFDESVSNISTDDFTLVTAGTASGTIASVSAASGSSITVTVNTITGTGTLRLNLNGSTNIADVAGNGVAAYSSGTSHTVDRDAPAAPSTPDLDAASDTGVSNTDNITGDNTPTFNGTAEANATVTVISSLSGTLGSTTADGSGNWSYTAGAMANGVHNITATATDAAGNVSVASAALAVTIDGPVTVTTNADSGADATIDGSLATDLTDGAGLSLREALAYVAASGTVDFAVGLSGTTITLGAPLTVPAGITLDADALGIATITGSTFTLAGSLGLNNGSGDRLTLSSELTGTGALTKTGAGRLILTNVNNSTSYSGDVTVTAGELWIGSDSAFSSGTLTLNGGVLGNNSSSFVFDNPIVLGASGGGVQVLNAMQTFTLSGNISGSGALNKTSGGTLVLSGTNSFSGGLSISGTNGVSVTDSSNLGSGTVTINPSSLLTLTGTAQTITNAIALAGDATISNANAMTISGVISGSDALTKAGAGVLTFTSANTATGALTIAAGGVTLSGGSALADAVAVTVDSGATLTLPSGSETIGSLAGAGNLVLNGALTLGGNNSSTTLAGVVSGTGSLIKSGTGVFKLAGVSSYTGATQVSAGSLIVNGAIATSSGVTVASAATLGGTGTLPNVAVANGGNLSPGDAGVGILSIANGLTINSGGNLLLDIAGTTAGTQYDQLNVTGTVSLAGASIAVTHSYVAANGDTYEVIVNDGVDAITGTFTGIAEGGAFIAGGNSSNLIVSYAAGSGNDLSLTNTLLPGAPTGVSAVAGNTSAQISFSAPAATGGSAITGYTVTASPGGATATGAASPISVTGLTNGIAYTFTVTATNATGTGSASAASGSVTPQGPQTITFTSPGAQTVGNSLTVTATASSGLTPAFTSTTPSVCTVTSGGAVTLVAAGTCSLTASQAGNAAFTAAAPVSQSFLVNPAPNVAPVITQGSSTSVTMSEDGAPTPFALALTATDGNSDPLTWSISTGPQHGSASVSGGSVSYTPTANYNGSDSFVVQVSDGTDSASITVNVTITAVNDAPVISGTPAISVEQDIAYSFTPGASDVDVGDTLTFSITNKPTWASFNTATGALTGTPTNADAGISGGIVISLSDGTATVSLPVFEIEVIATIDPLQPVVTAPANLEINATGLFTPVTVNTLLGLSSSATQAEIDLALKGLASDGVSGNTCCVTNAEGVTGNRLLLAPGRHQIKWKATNAVGVSGEAMQVVDVKPLVSLSKSQIAVRGSNVTFSVILNGKSPTYPLDIPYVIDASSTATGSEHNLVNGVARFTQAGQLEVTVPVTLAPAAGLSDSKLVVALGGGINAGANNRHSIDIREGNVPPVVSMSLSQGGIATSLVTPNGGPVTVVATVKDPNKQDTHSFDWSATSGLADTDGNPVNASRTFDPAGLVGGHQVQVTVTDSAGAAVSAQVYFRVVASLPVLDGNVDTDQDGINDALEGTGDSDNNGIPDYLDNMPSSNILPQTGKTTNSYLIECDPGVRCGLGLYARGSKSGGVQILNEELGSLDNLVADPAFEPVGGVFDFAINDLPTPGQSISVVIPQQAPIPAQAQYRKFQKGRWVTFIENANNRVASAAGNPGYCPPPGAAEWIPGLTAGHVCVQLTIEDGGPNDDDGLVNSAVVDPGAVSKARAVQPPVEPPVEPPKPPVQVNSKGGGAVPALWLFLLGGLVIFRRATPARLAAILLTVFSLNTQALEDTYVRLDLFTVNSSHSEADFTGALEDAGHEFTLTRYDDSRTGFQLTLGYQWSALTYTEVGYLDLGKVEVQLTLDGDTDLDAFARDFAKEYPITATGATLVQGFSHNFSPAIALSAEAGAFIWRGEVELDNAVFALKDDDGVDPLLGVKIDLALSDAFSLGFSGRRIFFGGQDIDLYSFGSTLRF
ncbi:Ig-like domain-containing protein [Cellvibrio sp. OA-2007]|uniref:Ig-like domain-containing protein n=1 Tax=Cellvibrio sp. OA-2007 TaxID=529823 RepID=UPI00187C67C6|nr:Ig-like domain-containing protein [Cellvibrio sp. OA-2007]